MFEIMNKALSERIPSFFITRNDYSSFLKFLARQHYCRYVKKRIQNGCFHLQAFVVSDQIIGIGCVISVIAVVLKTLIVQFLFLTPHFFVRNIVHLEQTIGILEFQVKVILLLIQQHIVYGVHKRHTT